jgi:transposase
MDTHSQTTDICVKTRPNGPGRHYRVKTSIAEIGGVIEQVGRPRELVLEEGPLAGWLLRNLRGRVEKAVSCDPRKNALIAKDGDKDDPIDASKLCDLYIGGYTREVHHSQSLSREVAKQAVGMYHERVAHRVAQANKALGLLKRWGVMAREKDFQKKDQREKLLAALGSGAAVDGVAGVEDVGGVGPSSPQTRLAAGHINLLWRSYDEAVREEERMRREVVSLAKEQEVVVRWQKVPGIGGIRGMTLLVYLDTPWRFASKRKLWKYMGIGLTRQHSGSGSTRVHVDQGANHLLKGVIIGAAETVIMHKSGELYRRYERWREDGLSFQNARRNVARDVATICWALWKHGGEFDERLIGGLPVPEMTEGGGL